MSDQSAKKIYGVLGNPAKHSLSPLMQNAAFQCLGINAEYRIFEKPPEDLSVFLKSLPAEGIFGLNVTIPYKEKVIPFLDKISPEAKLIAAVNTVRVSGQGLEGFNTDGTGFMRSLNDDLRFNPEGKKVSIIGAGGASRAVSFSLSQKKPAQLSIYDIDQLKAIALTEDLKNNFKDTDFKAADSIDALSIASADLLINCSPVGMKEDDPCLLRESFLHQGLYVYDLIYIPYETKFLKSAKAKGLAVLNGLNMLLCQGMLSFEIWTGIDAPKEIMFSALKEGIEKCKI